MKAVSKLIFCKTCIISFKEVFKTVATDDIIEKTLLQKMSYVLKCSLKIQTFSEKLIYT